MSDCSEFQIKQVSSLTDFNVELRHIIVLRTVCIKYHINYQFKYHINYQYQIEM